MKGSAGGTRETAQALGIFADDREAGSDNCEGLAVPRDVAAGMTLSSAWCERVKEVFYQALLLLRVFAQASGFEDNPAVDL